MAAVTSENNKSKIVVVDKMRDYSKEPIFKEKAEKALAFIKKHGLPEAFTKKQK